MIIKYLVFILKKKKTGNRSDWPSYSFYLHLCNFFLWGHLKDKAYRTQPLTLYYRVMMNKHEVIATEQDILKKTIRRLESWFCHVIKCYKIIVMS